MEDEGKVTLSLEDNTGTIKALKYKEQEGKISVSHCPETVFLNVYGAQESIPRNEFRQPGGPVRKPWRAGTKTLFLIGA